MFSNVEEEVVVIRNGWTPRKEGNGIGDSIDNDIGCSIGNDIGCSIVIGDTIGNDIGCSIGNGDSNIVVILVWRTFVKCSPPSAPSKACCYGNSSWQSIIVGTILFECWGGWHLPTMIRMMM